mmetsp:Transcript_20384/g.57964  ORF Transcript_20384/g.57964 Transcript_20384/m.57964 type:complete len:351 (+) Transcript_20384:1578-2630(+)
MNRLVVVNGILIVGRFFVFFCGFIFIVVVIISIVVVIVFIAVLRLRFFLWQEVVPEFFMTTTHRCDHQMVKDDGRLDVVLVLLAVGFLIRIGHVASGLVCVDQLLQSFDSMRLERTLLHAFEDGWRDENHATCGLFRRLAIIFRIIVVVVTVVTHHIIVRKIKQRFIVFLQELMKVWIILDLLLHAIFDGVDVFIVTSRVVIRCTVFIVLLFVIVVVVIIIIIIIVITVTLQLAVALCVTYIVTIIGVINGRREERVQIHIPKILLGGEFFINPLLFQFFRVVVGAHLGACIVAVLGSSSTSAFQLALVGDRSLLEPGGNASAALELSCSLRLLHHSSVHQINQFNLSLS